MGMKSDDDDDQEDGLSPEEGILWMRQEQKTGNSSRHLSVPASHHRQEAMTLASISSDIWSTQRSVAVR